MEESRKKSPDLSNVKIVSETSVQYLSHFNLFPNQNHDCNYFNNASIYMCTLYFYPSTSPYLLHVCTFLLRVFQVRTWRRNLYTCFQLGGVAMLWAVKISPAALAFPFFLILLVPIRKVMEKIFTQKELDAVSWLLFLPWFYCVVVLIIPNPYI